MSSSIQIDVIQENCQKKEWFPTSKIGGDHIVEKTEKEEYLKGQLMPILLGLITDSILDSITELDLTQRVIIISSIAIIYAVFYMTWKRSKYKQVKLKIEESKKPKELKESEKGFLKGILSRRVTVLLLVGFIVAIVLVCAASIVLGFTVERIFLLVGWLLLMIIFVLSGAFFSVDVALLLRGIAAVSLGGALSIGSVPTYGFLTAEPVELTIQNGCSTPLVYELLNINVSGFTTQTVELKPLTVTFTREGDFVFVYALCQTVPYYVPKDAFVSFDGQVIKPGESLTVDLGKQKVHEFFIKCV